LDHYLFAPGVEKGSAVNHKLLLGLLAALLPICAAQASPNMFSFTGAIDNDPFGVFDNATFDGSYTFDSTMTQVLNSANSGGYAGSGGIFNMNVAFTGTLDPSVAGPYIADTLNITVNNNFPGPLDEYLVTGTSSTDSMLSMEIRLDDFSGTAFSNTSLPLTPPSLAAFTSVRFALFDGTLDNPIEAEDVLRTLQCTAGCGRTVPEPNAILLLGAALGAFGLSRRRAALR
jgi:PEP-CTERM motif